MLSKALVLAALLGAAKTEKLPEQHELPKTESTEKVNEVQNVCLKNHDTAAAGGMMAGLTDLGPVGWGLLAVGGVIAIVSTGGAAIIAANSPECQAQRAAQKEKEAVQRAEARSSRTNNNHVSHGRGKNGR